MTDTQIRGRACPRYSLSASSLDVLVKQRDEFLQRMTVAEAELSRLRSLERLSEAVSRLSSNDLEVLTKLAAKLAGVGSCSSCGWNSHDGACKPIEKSTWDRMRYSQAIMLVETDL